MNGVIGTIGTEQVSILCGEHHIVQSGAIKDGITGGIQAGSLLCFSTAGYTLAAADSAQIDAVALEEFTEKTSGTVLPVCVHGTVRAEKLLLAGTAATEAVRAKLRAAGIYAIGALA